MRIKILMGLVVASAAMTSCSTEPVAAPLVTSSFHLNTTDPCVPTAMTTSTTPPTPDLCAPPVLTGRMTGGGGQVAIGDVYITRGFTLHCDITLSNNLEINWPGNKWHLDKPITAARCIDDPSISPEPPAAPFDTFLGTAIGRLNGVDGSRIEFAFADAGEPGGRNDRSGMRIYDANGVVVLYVPYSFLTKGNLQAHEDQPHR